MGLLDYMEGAKNKLAGLLGEMPISRMIHEGVQPPTVNGLRDALYAMPKPFNADDQAANEAAMAFWNPAGLLGKIVYHGSPHKFTKFDASKIGTGEGAQAYGHGTYLADAPAVAGEYIMAGRNMGLSNFDSVTQMADRALGFAKGDRAGALKYLDDAIAATKGESKRSNLALAKQTVERGDTKASLYKADLPDEWIPKMLDWDKPLKEQGLQIGKDDVAKSAINQWVRAGLPPNAEPTGAGLVEALTEKLGSKKAAADFLREQGIPGIRYLDGGSRGAGQGSYNYVVFPGLEDQVKILERNGKGLLDY